MYISRKKFTTYEEIRVEGKFNMFDVNNVVVRSCIIDPGRSNLDNVPLRKVKRKIWFWQSTKYLGKRG